MTGPTPPLFVLFMMQPKEELRYVFCAEAVRGSAQTFACFRARFFSLR